MFLSFLFEDGSLPSTFASPPLYVFIHPSLELLTAALRVNSRSSCGWRDPGGGVSVRPERAPFQLPSPPHSHSLKTVAPWFQERGPEGRK